MSASCPCRHQFPPAHERSSPSKERPVVECSRGIAKLPSTRYPRSLDERTRAGSLLSEARQRLNSRGAAFEHLSDRAVAGVERILSLSLRDQLNRAARVATDA